MLKKTDYLVWIGIGGSFLSVMADLSLAFFPQGVYGFETVFTVDVDKVFTVLSQASHERLLLSNYLAAIGIPLGWFGVYYVYLQLGKQGSQLILSRILIIAASIGYLCGTLFHVSLSYIATAYRVMLETDAQDSETIASMIKLFADFSQPLAYVFLAAIFLVSMIFFTLVFFNHSRFPRWIGLANPFCIQLALAFLASFLPLAGKTFLTVSVYNFSLLIFYLACFFSLNIMSTKK